MLRDLIRLALGFSMLISAAAAASPWTLVWSDEFNGPAGAAPDPAKWTYDLGGGGWGNRELETYTNSRSNSYRDGNGNLVIQSLQTSPGVYTSARLKTQGLYANEYGRIEARIKIPYGQGMWPAFWLLGNNIDKVNWPDCGEIDIMENIGKEPGTVHGTIHGPGYANAGIGQAFSLPSGSFSGDYRVFAVEWSAKQVEFYVDGQRYFSATPASLPSGGRWVFDHPFFIILNVAVGGAWPGNPDGTTVFPQQMLVDYVRVYQR